MTQQCLPITAVIPAHAADGPALPATLVVLGVIALVSAVVHAAMSFDPRIERYRSATLSRPGATRAAEPGCC